MIYRSKYGSKKITVDGITYDSKKEYARHCELKLLERAGVISGLKRQVKYQLLPSQKDATGKVIERPVVYVADFEYIENDRKVTEDVKGVRTKEYIIKRKLMLYMHGVRIREV